MLGRPQTTGLLQPPLLHISTQSAARLCRASVIGSVQNKHTWLDKSKAVIPTTCGRQKSQEGWGELVVTGQMGASMPRWILARKAKTAIKVATKSIIVEWPHESLMFLAPPHIVQSKTTNIRPSPFRILIHTTASSPQIHLRLIPMHHKYA